MNEPECDSTTGICSPGEAAGATSDRAVAEDRETVVYSGDPMCSWCWGMAPTLHRFQRCCEDVGIPFRVLVGGLRPGGGDPWNRQFREFLGHHWQEVASRTGQPFDHRLLERDSFEYDTEPACRAVVAARPLIEGTELPFFSAIQRKFYVDGEDPKEREFYGSICEQHGLEYDAFAQRFDSDTVRHAGRIPAQSGLGRHRLPYRAGSRGRAEPAPGRRLRDLRRSRARAGTSCSETGLPMPHSDGLDLPARCASRRRRNRHRPIR